MRASRSARPCGPAPSISPSPKTRWWPEQAHNRPREAPSPEDARSSFNADHFECRGLLVRKGSKGQTERWHIIARGAALGARTNRGAALRRAGGRQLAIGRVFMRAREPHDRLWLAGFVCE